MPLGGSGAKGRGSGGKQGRLMDVNTGRLSGLNYKLAPHMVRGGIREFVYDMDGPAFRPLLESPELQFEYHGLYMMFVK